MPKLSMPCTVCGKDLKLLRDYTLDGTRLYEYKCGHIFSRDITRIDKSALDFTSTDGYKKARHYQEDGVEFILNSDFNCIIGDQMRLGKTPQSLLALKNKLAERTPALILVRSANLWQWTREFQIWVTTLPNGIWLISGTKGFIPPGFSAYIISMDTFSRRAMLDKLKLINFKLIIADEAHSFKNIDSNRSQALTELVKHLNTGEWNKELRFSCSRCLHEWTEKGKEKYDKRIGHQVVSKGTYCPSCQAYCYIQQNMKEATNGNNERPCGLVLLTGTAIKNRADEYFVPLNLINPDKFHSLDSFRRRWLEQDVKEGKILNKWSRIKPYLLDSFKDEIKPYVLRREKEDVYTDLPALNRIFTVIEPEKGELTNAYNQILDKLDLELADKVNPTFWDMQENMMALRRITGLMKVMWVADYLEEALEGSSEQRYAVGIHHKSVRDILYLKMNNDTNCLKLSGEDNAQQKDRIMRQFEHSSQRILILNMLAGGVGMDFHYCNNILILERQWNAADEQQFEFRFYNPDRSIKNVSTNVEYIVTNTPFEMEWYNMVEEKRRIFGETISEHFDLTSDPATFRELLDRVQGRRL